MLTVNLMPWRARRKRQHWQQGGRLCGAVVLLIILALQSGYWQQQLNHQRASLLSSGADAQQHLALLHERTLAAQQRLSQLMQVEQRRRLQQQDLSRWMNFIQLLSAEIPQDIWLDGLKKRQQSITLSGFSRSVAALHQLRDRLHQQQEILSVKPGALRREPSADVSFSMQLSLGNGEPGHE